MQSTILTWSSYCIFTEEWYKEAELAEILGPESPALTSLPASCTRDAVLGLRGPEKDSHSDLPSHTTEYSVHSSFTALDWWLLPSSPLFLLSVCSFKSVLYRIRTVNAAVLFWYTIRTCISSNHALPNVSLTIIWKDVVLKISSTWIQNSSR